jgi:hypothetical protein
MSVVTIALSPVAFTPRSLGDHGVQVLFENTGEILHSNEVRTAGPLILAGWQVSLPVSKQTSCRLAHRWRIVWNLTVVPLAPQPHTHSRVHG